jgi:elongation factor 1-delta
MSLAALAQEKFWENKAQCEDAENAFHMGLSGAKAKGSSPSSLAAEIAKARQHIKNSLECVDVIEATAAATGGAVDAGVMKKLKDLELENKDLKKVTGDLKAMVLKLENRVSSLEKGAPAAAPAPAKAAPAPAAADDEDSDCDLFGSDSESEDDEEKKKRTEERLAAYHAKKAGKKVVIAKTSVCLDIKPWDDETDMGECLKLVKTIEKDGLVWGASKLVPVGYGINKLRIIMVVEDEKVSIDEVQEQIAEFEDFVQSVDVESMQKI